MFRDPKNRSPDFYQSIELALSNIGDVVWMRDLPKKRMIYISPAYEQVWGRPCQELYDNPQSFLNAIHPDDRERVITALSIQKTTPYQETYRILTPQGKMKWIFDRSFPIRDESGEVNRMLGMASDITEKVQQQEALQQQVLATSQRMQVALSAMEMGVWEIDLRNNKIFWDDNLYQLMGIKPGVHERIEDAWNSVIHPADAERVEAEFRAAIAGKADFNGQYRIIYKGEETRIMRGKAQVICDENQVAIRIVGCQWNHTEQEKMHNELKESKEFLHNVMNAVGDPIFVKDQSHRWIYGNEAFSKILRLKPEEYYGKTDHELFPKQMADVFWENDDKVFESLQANENEESLQLPTGEVRTILTKKTPYASKDGSLILIGIIRDITERKKMEDELHNSYALIESSSDLYGICDLEGRLMFLNAAARKFLNILPGQFNVHVSAVPALGAFFRYKAGVPDAEKNWEGENDIFSPHEGCNVALWQKIFVTKDAKGQAKFVATLATDIRKRKESEIKLAQSARLASLGEMSGGVAHEINNPLMVVIGKATLMRRKLEQTPLDIPSLIDDLEKIESTSMRMAKIIKSLRSLSSDTEQEPLEMVKLAPIIEETLEVCRERFKNHGVEFRCDYPQDLVLFCRQMQVAQVLFNLLSNAFHASMDHKGAWIELKAKNTGSAVEISISDSGPGIAPDIRDKIMRPFFSTKPLGKGTGLGLSISKRMIEGHGGELYLDSSAPNTRFVVVLPLTRTD